MIRYGDICYIVNIKPNKEFLVGNRNQLKDFTNIANL